MKRVCNSLFTKTVFFILAITFAASPVQALPPDPDNAALLYYQGFLSLTELDEEARDRIADVARGKVEPDDKVREDISKCIGAIELAEAASEVPACNWGVRYSQGFNTLMPQLAQVRFLTFVLVADARVRASDGNYKGALERCLMTGTLARHVGDDTIISYLVSLAVRSLGYKCMQDVMNQAGCDEKLLLWLKEELATSPVDTISLIRPLKIEIEIMSDLMRMNNIQQLARVLADTDQKSLLEIVTKVNEDILGQNRRIYTGRMKSALTVLSTSVPYEQAYPRLEQLMDDFDPNNPKEQIAGVFTPALGRVLTLKTRAETHANALKAAIEIYLTKIKTGRLPDALPEDMPKDLFSGKDFEYEKDENGFLLRCNKKDLGKDGIHEYKFKLKK
jgi:hypothetical protein